MKIFYADHFVLPLPPGHRFPMSKYSLLRSRVSSFDGIELHEAPLALKEQILLAHTSEYVERVCSGQLSHIEQRVIGFPWSEEMVERSRRSAGATIAACRAAWIDGVAANLAGGTHHAYADKGRGFCVFNDAAIAARTIQQDLLPILGRKCQISIIDLDVHQGNGTASIFKEDKSIFTLSIHGEKNFPFRKEDSDLDIGLPDGCGDNLYLNALEQALKELDQLFVNDLVIFLAGADPHEGDRLGRLSLSLDGLRLRDQLLLDWCFMRHLPIAITMAGGYGHRIEDTVDVHAQTINIAMGNVWI